MSSHVSRYISRKVNGAWTAVKVEEEAPGRPTCPYCKIIPYEDLVPQISFDCVISGKHVDWFECPGCGVGVEVIDGEVILEKVGPPQVTRELIPLQIPRRQTQ